MMAKKGTIINDVMLILVFFNPSPCVMHLSPILYALLSKLGLPPAPLCLTSFMNDPKPAMVFLYKKDKNIFFYQFFVTPLYGIYNAFLNFLINVIFKVLLNYFRAEHRREKINI